MTATYNAQTVYEKMKNGDSISDEELEYGVQFFEELAAKLRQVGPTFDLASREANRVYQALWQYKMERSRDI